MISVTAAKNIILNHITLLEPVKIKLSAAAGHVLSADVYAEYDIPAFRQSSMDGYAFRFEEAEESLQVRGEMAAGSSVPIEITHKNAVRIFTGAPLPEGADTVVMQERVTLEAGHIRIADNNLNAGGNVRGQGSEIKAGAMAMEQGSLLTPAAIGFLAGIGTDTVEVYPMPRVSLITTGKELQQPGRKLDFGQVYESNSYSLSAAMKKEGICRITLFEADDQLDLLKKVLDEALDHSDVVLLTGGVSVGDYDFVIEASRLCGIAQLFHKVKQKPGKPLYFGKKARQLVFGLPGNPASVLSCFYNYVLPALKALSHQKNPVTELSAMLTHPYNKPAGLTHFLKGNYKNGLATPLQAQESYRLSTFAQANCLICLDEEKENFQEGEKVTVMLLPD